jgi:putative peptide zinc metalloprotease protein
VLPPIREELILHPGPATADGAPAWTIEDPVRHLFFRVDALAFELLCRWSLGEAQRLLAAVQYETALRPEAADLQQLLDFLDQNELLQRTGAEESHRLYQRWQQRRSSGWSWLLHRYLFFRIPLVNPDRFLRRTLHWVAPFYQPLFGWLTLLALLVGASGVARQWEPFRASLPDLFTLQGVVSIGAALIVVKLLHELGHAYTARRHGCEVPTMGIAFLVLFPMAYTDVNAVWRLERRSARLQVGAAGMATELTVAIWATLGWTLLGDGALRDALFFLATTSWVSSLLINASPFLRFDGYFLLMDAVGVANLHSRAFAFGRWRLREGLFGLGLHPPEPLAHPVRRALIAFAWLTWSYRLLVFVAIALLVYHLFPKPLGPLLAAVELGWFIVLPVARELGQWWQIRRTILQRRRSWLLLLLVLVVLAVALLPWDRRLIVQGVVIPQQRAPLVAPETGRLARIIVASGETVQAGEALLELTSPDLEAEIRQAEGRLEQLQWQLGRVALGRQGVSRIELDRQSLREQQAQRASLDERMGELTLHAPIDGQLQLTPPGRHPGEWLGEGEPIGEVVSAARVVEGYVEAMALERLAPGQRGWFYPEAGGERLGITLDQIDRDATATLPQRALAGLAGGELLVRDHRGQLHPERTLYRIRLTPDPATTTLSTTTLSTTILSAATLRGRIHLRTQPRAWLDGLWQRIASVVVREAGL